MYTLYLKTQYAHFGYDEFVHFFSSSSPPLSFSFLFARLIFHFQFKLKFKRQIGNIANKLVGCLSFLFCLFFFCLQKRIPLLKQPYYVLLHRKNVNKIYQMILVTELLLYIFEPYNHCCFWLLFHFFFFFLFRNM